MKTICNTGTRAWRRTQRQRAPGQPGGGPGGSSVAESVGFEPTVPSRVHLISNQAPSATRTALRRATCKDADGLSSALALLYGHRSTATVLNGCPPRTPERFAPRRTARCARDPAAGEMTEWPKVHDWKSCVPARVPRVRIPLSPPIEQRNRSLPAPPYRPGPAPLECLPVPAEVGADGPPIGHARP